MEHYFSKNPVSEPKENIVRYKLNNLELSFFTSSSVFSKRQIDKGTALLIKACRINIGAKVLDIGCGYGVVGISVSRLYPRTQVTMSDINERAIALAKKNSVINKADVNIISSDMFENIHESFNVILSNPPQSAGKKLCFELIVQSFLHLENGGSLQLVARNQKGGKELSKKMMEIFGNNLTIARKSGYHIYYSVKSL